MLLRAIKLIGSNKLVGYGYATNENKTGVVDSDSEWSSVTFEDNAMPNLSDFTIDKLYHYGFSCCPINPFIINEEENKIYPISDEEIFKSIISDKEIDKTYEEYNRDKSFADKYEMTVLEAFPEKYVDSNDGIMFKDGMLVSLLKPYTNIEENSEELHEDTTSEEDVEEIETDVE